MSNRESVKIVNAALDETDGRIILRGVIHPDSLRLLKAAPYQREVLEASKINALMSALATGNVPDVELGMRGEEFSAREDIVYLQDTVYIIDGLQRVTAGIQLLEQGAGHQPRIGAAIHFNTDEKWERDRFKILNLYRSKLSPNVLLRNMKEDNQAVEILYALCEDRNFVLKGRVCWHQNMLKEHLITARTYVRTAGILHGHLGPGRSTQTDAIANGAQAIMEKTGPNVFRANIRTFFDLVDQCWGIQRIAIKSGAVYLRGNFLCCLANLCSRHDVFWKENRLFVEKDLMRKIAQFPVADPEISRLASAGGMAADILYRLLVEHVNNGKRTKRLVAREDIGGSLVDSEEVTSA